MMRKFMGLVLATTLVMAMSINAFAATSELTGQEISDDIKNQRPVAIMVDNEKVALDHYGVSEADIVYEMMNSTANGRITRLMCIYKDWQNLGQTGSIRSVRTTNVILADEFDAVLIHDGGPFYIDTYFAQPYAEHLSAGFTRVNNGKRREFTEYVFGSELVKRFQAAGLSASYTQYSPERASHFVFGENQLANGSDATVINMSGAFPHNQSKLVYNNGTYDYYEYGRAHKDVEDGVVATFKNVILQDVTFSKLDANGYLTYNVIGSGVGYYITNGKLIPITWSKGSETGMTRYYDQNGKEIVVNRGKTYVGIIPNDAWSTLTFN